MDKNLESIEQQISALSHLFADLSNDERLELIQHISEYLEAKKDRYSPQKHFLRNPQNID